LLSISLRSYLANKEFIGSFLSPPKDSFTIFFTIYLNSRTKMYFIER
jgi:hypothetical protein